MDEKTIDVPWAEVWALALARITRDGGKLRPALVDAAAELAELTDQPSETRDPVALNRTMQGLLHGGPVTARRSKTAQTVTLERDGERIRVTMSKG